MEYGKVKSDGLNLHAKPDVHSRLVDQLNHGDEMVVLLHVPKQEHHKVTWLKVQTVRTNDVGYVSAAFVHTHHVPDAEPPQPADDEIAAPDEPMFPFSLKGWLLGLGVLALLAAIYWIGGR